MTDTDRQPPEQTPPAQVEQMAWVFCWWERAPVIRLKRVYPYRPADHHITRDGAVRAGQAWIAKERAILDQAEAALAAGPGAGEG